MTPEVYWNQGQQLHKPSHRKSRGWDKVKMNRVHTGGTARHHSPTPLSCHIPVSVRVKTVHCLTAAHIPPRASLHHKDRHTSSSFYTPARLLHTLTVFLHTLPLSSTSTHPFCLSSLCHRLFTVHSASLLTTP
ncbi:hypothetical protein Pcinc_017048 [Petrolisthes cinctipes]|uniref:Uncharacterized protein n=1 Tax=Petrolisthes cinctipes TaxID=88211 RepID=A0AAE1KQC2_PETCI|nr:hypothetical protein Pcinc_017048 [Petrolisthes cinctipes]